jgi:hypothetical protein
MLLERALDAAARTVDLARINVLDHDPAVYVRKRLTTLAASANSLKGNWLWREGSNLRPPD